MVSKHSPQDMRWIRQIPGKRESASAGTSLRTRCAEAKRLNASETIRPVTKSVRVEQRTGTTLFLLKKTGGDRTIQSVKSDVRK